MASKKLRPQGELAGTTLGDKDLGRLKLWSGRHMGPDIIAAVSKGRQYDGAEKGRCNQGAPLRAGNQAVTKRMDPGDPPMRKGYGGIDDITPDNQSL